MNGFWNDSHNVMLKRHHPINQSRTHAHTPGEKMATCDMQGSTVLLAGLYKLASYVKEIVW